MRGELKDNYISVDLKGKITENGVKPTVKERVKAADALAKRYGLDKVLENNNDSGQKDTIKQLVELIGDLKK